MLPSKLRVIPTFRVEHASFDMAPTPDRIILRRGDGRGVSNKDTWMTLGIIVAAVVLFSVVTWAVVRALRRRRQNRGKVRNAMKHPREWYRKHQSVREILQEEELARITQIRKSLQGRQSGRSSRSSNTSGTTRTPGADHSLDLARVEENVEERREDVSKEWENRMSGSTRTSTRDLEAQGHPAFIKRPATPTTPTSPPSICSDGTAPPRIADTKWPLVSPEVPQSPPPQPPSPARVK